MQHAKFMLKLLQSPIPWICCLRAKHKTRQTRTGGRTEIVKDDFTTPLTSDDFIFEMTSHGEIMQDHTFRLTKCSHPSLRQAMPNNEPMTVEHGRMLAAWCASPGKPVASAPDVKSLKARLWALAQQYVGKGSTLPEIEAALKSKGVCDKPLAELDAEALSAAASKLETLLADVIP